MGMPKETIVSTPSYLDVSENLPKNLCIFIIDKFEYPQITSISQLFNWGDALFICQKFGKVVQFPAVDTNIFDIVSKMKAQYSPNIMNIDTGNQCPCKIQSFKGGLVIVRIPDNEPNTLDEILPYLPEETGVAFIASTDTHFRY
ncbi:hypothetical protein GPJ56_001461 [Histomonas meleagridis]|uniref:uncharacterized protein n=1 Tax=Histomonas meleagridis TaxID=135588 RepID=UPI00355A7FCC|nr:hypothetical protein GPJ56_001461 [Histomonas meleagridis]KAH0798222.1 hypothetical protein GO595_009068 [Histomonas meleagridis]